MKRAKCGDCLEFKDVCTVCFICAGCKCDCDQDYLDFLDGGMEKHPDLEFVKERIIPALKKHVADFGDGWLEEGMIHSREVDAVVYHLCKLIGVTY